MCGRFQLLIELEKILERYQIKSTDINFEPKNEVFPSDKSIVVTSNNGQRDLDILKWGFTVPFTKRLLINARSETAFSKPTFKDSFIHRRGLLPVSGYYEWKNGNGKKVKYKIYSEDDIISLACIYKTFTDSLGNPVKAYTILTRAANKEIEDIHHRMPVIIDRKHEDIWIDDSIKDIHLLNNIVASSNKKLLLEKV